MLMKKTILIALFLCLAGSMTCFADVIIVHEDDFEDRDIGSTTEGWIWANGAAAHEGLYADFEGSIVREHTGTINTGTTERYGYKTDIEMTGNTSDDPADYTFELDIRNLQGEWDPHEIEIFVLTYNPEAGGGTYGFGIPLLELYQEDEWVHVEYNLADLAEINKTWWEGTDWDMTSPTWSYEIGGPPYPGVEVPAGTSWIQVFLVDNLKITMIAEPPEFAKEPVPADQSIDVLRDVVLSWTPGDFSDKRNVYLGTDVNDVNEASADDPRGVLVSEGQVDASYDPPGLLDWDQTYYWRIDEVNEAEPNSPWKGDLWSFTTRNFVSIDDFEDYNDWEPDTIYLAWIDGYGDPANGSTSGYPEPIFSAGEHFVETTTVHGGLQSMPLFYDNTVAGLSEVTKTLTDVTDWTVDDVLALTLFYYGDAGNSPETMYVVIDGDAVITNPDPRAALNNEWTRWDIMLQDIAGMGVNLSNVTSMSIGFGDKAMPVAGGSGLVFFDDIRLSRTLPEDVEPEPESVDPGTADLRAYYAFENNVQDTSGGGWHGTISGNPTYVAGPTGYGNALALDGTGDYVTLPIGSLIASTPDITIACWVNFSNQAGSWQRISDFGTGEDTNMFVTPRIGTAGDMRFAITSSGSGGESNVTAPTALPTGWHHVTAVIDSSTMTMLLYQDGRVVAEGTTVVLPSDMGTTTQNYIGLSQYAADGLLQAGVDEFRIYDSALSLAEVLFLAGK